MIQRMTLSDYGIQNGVISTVSRQSELAPFQFHHASGGQLANEQGGYPTPLSYWWCFFRLNPQQAKDKDDFVLNDLLEEHVPSIVVAWTCVVEFQKRGLPVAHILLVTGDEATKKAHCVHGWCACMQSMHS